MTKLQCLETTEYGADADIVIVLGVDGPSICGALLMWTDSFSKSLKTLGKKTQNNSRTLIKTF